MANTFQAYSGSQLTGINKRYFTEVNNISNDIGSGALSCVIAGGKQWQIFSDANHFGVTNTLSVGTYETAESMGMPHKGALSARHVIHDQSQ
jgi:hypothetical protein